MSVIVNGVESINGCEVIMTIGDVKIIEHPTGFMAYAGFRLGTRKTRRGIIALAKRNAQYGSDQEESVTT